MSYKFPHQVVITPVTYDENFRTETEGTSFSSDAQVERDNQVSYTANGQVIKPAVVIHLPPGTDIAEGYKIDYQGKEYRANSVFRVYEHHIEVMC